VEGNLFIFGLVCYLGTGSQKINILTAQDKRISNKQAVCNKLLVWPSFFSEVDYLLSKYNKLLHLFQFFLRRDKKIEQTFADDRSFEKFFLYSRAYT
jgi:hypothetical protein